MTATEPAAKTNGNGRARTRDLVAAALRYGTKKFTGQVAQATNTGGRQAVAWSFWHDTPEVGFAGSWIGNVMGRARLFAGRREDDGSITPLDPSHPASQLVRTIGGGPAGQAQMLTEFGPHLVVAGEAWVVLEPAPPGDGNEEWHLVSVLEVTSRGVRSGLEVQLPDRKLLVPADDDPDPDAPIAIRVWQPNPARHAEADSPILRSFALLEELRLLNAAIAAIAKSRLTGRGIVFIPQGTKFPTAPGGGDAEDDLVDTLITVAELAYGDPSSAAAAVPIFLEVPDQFLGQAQHMKFDSDFDALAVTLREETIRRFATGLDTPAEILLGTGDISHWGQWSIEDGAVRVAIEPRLVLICDAFTEQWLHPALETLGPASGEEDLTRICVWYDASDLRPKTNRGQTAIELYDRGEINGDALRRELQFDDADKPSGEEAERQLLERLLLGAPSLAPILLPLLGIDLGPAAGPPPLPGLEEETEEGPGAPPAPDLPVSEDVGPPVPPTDRPDDDGLRTAPPVLTLPDGLSSTNQALVEAIDAVIHRALERAGQRYRSRTNRSQRSTLNDIAACSVHTATTVLPEAIDELGLLDDALDRLPDVADRYDLPLQVLTASVTDYLRELLTDGEEHRRERVPDLLEAVLLAAQSEG